MKNIYLYTFLTSFLAFISSSTMAQEADGSQTEVHQKEVVDNLAVFLRNSSNVPDWAYLEIMKQVDLPYGVPTEIQSLCTGIKTNGKELGDKDWISVSICVSVRPPEVLTIFCDADGCTASDE